MADIKSFPNNQDEYVGAEYMMHYLHGRTSGVFGADNNLRVVATESERAVTVTEGVGWMANANGNGVVIWNDDNNLKLKVDLADASKTRIDRVVVSWETIDYIARPKIEILKGVAGGEAPALTNSDTMRQISLAQIVIPTGALTITASMIKDERLDDTVCGIVTQSVGIDTSGINAQANGLIADMTKSFNKWFATAQDTLDGNTAGKLANLISNQMAIHAEVTLKADGWQKSGAFYTQTVAAPNMKDDGFPIYFMATYSKQAEKEFEFIKKLETNVGSVTVTAKYKPTIDLDIGIEVLY